MKQYPPTTRKITEDIDGLRISYHGTWYHSPRRSKARKGQVVKIIGLVLWSRHYDLTSLKIEVNGKVEVWQ